MGDKLELKTSTFILTAVLGLDFFKSLMTFKDSLTHVTVSLNSFRSDA